MLCFKRHSGSGLNLRPNDIGQMTLEEILWWQRWVTDRWKEQDEAIERANKR